MKLIDSVNQCLRSCSFPAVNELTVSDQNVAIAQRVIRYHRRAILSDGFPFNTSRLDLSVDTLGKVPISADYIRVRFPESHLTAHEQNGSLYVFSARTQQFVNSIVRGVEVVFDMTNFHHIPEKFAQWITMRAASKFYEEINQSPSPMLEHEATMAAARARNSIPQANFNNATGWTRLGSIQSGHADSRPWIHL